MEFNDAIIRIIIKGILQSVSDLFTIEPAINKIFLIAARNSVLSFNSVSWVATRLLNWLFASRCSRLLTFASRKLIRFFVRSRQLRCAIRSSSRLRFVLSTPVVLFWRVRGLGAVADLGVALVIMMVVYDGVAAVVQMSKVQ